MIVNKHHIKQAVEHIHFEKEQPLRNKADRIVKGLNASQKETAMNWMNLAMKKARSSATREHLSKHYYQLRNEVYIERN
jgi:F0F1-type ATP synthase membrane subunit b/b'